MSQITPEVDWRSLPLHPVARAARITGRSTSHVYSLINAKKLKAVRLAGKTLITTDSIVALLAQARPWVADRNRVAAANIKRKGIANT